MEKGTQDPQGYAESYSGNDGSREKRNRQSTHKVVAFYVGLALIVVTVVVFVILPAAVVFLAGISPESFTNVAAVKASESLRDGVNGIITLVSLIVGIVSIVYACISSNTVEKQSERQEAVLQYLQRESAKILQEVAVMNERIIIISERRGDLGYTTPRDPKAADEAH